MLSLRLRFLFLLYCRSRFLITAAYLCDTEKHHLKNTPADDDQQEVPGNTDRRHRLTAQGAQSADAPDNQHRKEIQPPESQYRAGFRQAVKCPDKVFSGNAPDAAANNADEMALAAEIGKKF